LLYYQYKNRKRFFHFLYSVSESINSIPLLHASILDPKSALPIIMKTFILTASIVAISSFAVAGPLHHSHPLYRSSVINLPLVRKADIYKVPRYSHQGKHDHGPHHSHGSLGTQGYSHASKTHKVKTPTPQTGRPMQQSSISRSGAGAMQGLAILGQLLEPQRHLSPQIPVA
jgi:hypothetical protein